MNEIVAAFMYDFDHTLSPRDMQEYAFIPKLGLTDREFWDKCDEAKKIMDPILGYMLVMLQEAEGKMLLTRDVFRQLGEKVELFKGVDTWFRRVNEHAAKLGITLEHYVISSGLKEIIEGTSIAKEFREIYAAEYHYNEKGIPIWPAMAVNSTSKTQFIFRVNKGVLSATDIEGLNAFVPHEERRVQFSNMVFFGDGYTDVPSMRVVNEYGGFSVAVYQDGRSETACQLVRDGRVDIALDADYSKGSRLEKAVFAKLDAIAANNRLAYSCDENNQKTMKLCE